MSQKLQDFKDALALFTEVTQGAESFEEVATRLYAKQDNRFASFDMMAYCSALLRALEAGEGATMNAGCPGEFDEN